MRGVGGTLALSYSTPPETPPFHHLVFRTLLCRSGPPLLPPRHCLTEQLASSWPSSVILQPLESTGVMGIIFQPTDPLVSISHVCYRLLLLTPVSNAGRGSGLLEGRQVGPKERARGAVLRPRWGHGGAPDTMGTVGTVGSVVWCGRKEGGVWWLECTEGGVEMGGGMAIPLGCLREDRSSTKERGSVIS